MAALKDVEPIPAFDQCEYAQPPIIQDQDINLRIRFEKKGGATISVDNGEDL